MKDFLKRVIAIREKEQFEARQQDAELDDWGEWPKSPCKVCGRGTCTPVAICTTHPEYHAARRKHLRELDGERPSSPCKVCGKRTFTQLEICTTHPEYGRARRAQLRAIKLEKLRAEWRARVNARNSKI